MQYRQIRRQFQVTPQVDNHVRQGNVFGTDRVAGATQRAGIQHLGQLGRLGAILARLGDTFRAEARVAPRSPHRADQATQAATAAGGYSRGWALEYIRRSRRD
jgi:hypothetical protein